MQKILIVALVVLACVMCLAVAQDVETIKSQIIAQYEQLGGQSTHHVEERADFIDAANFHIN